MSRRRIAGITLTAIGLAVAVAASLWLALQPGTLLTDSSQIVVMVAAFLAAFALMVAGAYVVVSAGQAAQPLPAEMETPLQLADYLRGRGPVTLDAAAAALETDLVTLLAAFEELTRLGLFSGYSQRSERLVCMVDAALLRQTERCAVCGAALRLSGGRTGCPQCHTEYYLPQE
jgi:hypothetical protein